MSCRSRAHKITHLITKLISHPYVLTPTCLALDLAESKSRDVQRLQNEVGRLSSKHANAGQQLGGSESLRLREATEAVLEEQQLMSASFSSATTTAGNDATSELRIKCNTLELRCERLAQENGPSILSSSLFLYRSRFPSLSLTALGTSI